jgi:ABC-type dipeptide/oligopeptide/nickel transport system permease component
MIRLAPGDPAEAFLSEARVTEEVLAQVRRQLGLDRPVPVQFLYYVGRVARGDFGQSFLKHEPVIAMISNVWPYTLELALAATIVASSIAIPLGVLAATHRNTVFDYTLSTVAAAVYSMPRFWVGLLLILAFAVRVQWFPVIGAGVEGGMFNRLYHLVLPTVTLGLSRAALLTRVTRSSVLESLRQDYVRTARSKGLAESRVLARHALRNALIPIITVTGLGFGRLIGGTILVEAVFVRPGLGTLLVEAIRARDYPVVQGTILFFALGIVVVNVMVDLMYATADPRIRYA